MKTDVLFYIIFCVFFLGMDSLDKNMSIAFDDIELNPDGSVKTAHARLFLRDTDTQSLFNNSGALMYKYWAEWNDAFNPTTGKTQPIAGETYDNDNHAWLPKMDEGYSPVFNGRLSGLVDLVWQCWGDDLAAMYKSMRDNGLQADNIFRRYTDFWRQWCENLYNADAMGYANTGHFTKAYGDKLNLMQSFKIKNPKNFSALIAEPNPHSFNIIKKDLEFIGIDVKPSNEWGIVKRHIEDMIFRHNVVFIEESLLREIDDALSKLLIEKNIALVVLKTTNNPVNLDPKIRVWTLIQPYLSDSLVRILNEAYEFKTQNGDKI